MTHYSIGDSHSLLLRSPRSSWERQGVWWSVGTSNVKHDNGSFESGIFPEEMKHAVVKPILTKTGLDAMDLKSWRLISNLSFTSKLAERIATSRLRTTVAARNTIHLQFHSTETALTAVVDKIVKAIDAGQVCALVLLDLSAAFDTIDHDILFAVIFARDLEFRMVQWIGFIHISWVEHGRSARIVIDHFAARYSSVFIRDIQGRTSYIHLLHGGCSRCHNGMEHLQPHICWWQSASCMHVRGWCRRLPEWHRTVCIELSDLVHGEKTPA